MGYKWDLGWDLGLGWDYGKWDGMMGFGMGFGMGWELGLGHLIAPKNCDQLIGWSINNQSKNQSK